MKAEKMQVPDASTPAAQGSIDPAGGPNASDAERSLFAVYWEAFDPIYTCGQPNLQVDWFTTLEAAMAFAQSPPQVGALVYGIFTGSTKPVIDKKRRKAWISRRRARAWRHR